MAETTRALVNLPPKSRSGDDFEMDNHLQIEQLRRLMADMQKEPLTGRDRELLQLQLNPMYPPVESIESGATSARSASLVVDPEYTLFHLMILERIEKGPTWMLNTSKFMEKWKTVIEDLLAEFAISGDESTYRHAPIHGMVRWLGSGMLFTWE